MKRPSFQFYPGDWMRDAALRSCSIPARGLWIDMMCIMHDGSPYGHLKVNSKEISNIQLGRMTGATEREIEEWMGELSDAGVLTRDAAGCIYSKRMVRDEQIREIRAAAGKEGGNPKLMSGYTKPGYVYAMSRASDGAIKIGISVDPAKRLYRIRQQYPEDSITIVGTSFVSNMGAREAELHGQYGHCKNGEWLSLTQEEIVDLLDVHLKVNSKEIQTPSSSSSSSSSKKEKTCSANRGTRLTADWKPTDEQIAWARRKRPDVDPIAEAENFRDFWIAKAGAGGVKLDWFATWRTWIRRANGSPRQQAAPRIPQAQKPVVVHQRTVTEGVDARVGGMLDELAKRLHV